MMITVIVPPVIAPALIVPAMIPPVMVTPYADHDSRAVVNRGRGRSIVDGRRGDVVHGRGHDYWRCHTDADPDVNIGLRRYGEPRQQRCAEKKVDASSFIRGLIPNYSGVPLRSTIPRCAEVFIRSPVYSEFLGGCIHRFFSAERGSAVGANADEAR
jgi:hypothetical protein